MTDDTYLTIASASTGIYKEKGSKFYAFAYPIENEEEIKLKLESVRKKYHDARHHCYAYMLGKGGKKYKSNDDGEPNHSAGDPILGQIKSNALSDVLIVVVRYFGGTKLGVGGLIKAYKTAAADAISNTTIIEKIMKQTVTIQFEYAQMNDVMKIIKSNQLEVIRQKLDMKCEIVVQVRVDLSEKITTMLKKFAKVISNHV